MAVAPNGDVFVADGEAGTLVILRDQNRDGVADHRFVFASDLNRPYGIAIGREVLWVGNTDAVVRFPYRTGDTKPRAKAVKILDLPSGGHWTRALALSPDEKKLYVGVGSDSNADTGEPAIRAAITELDLEKPGARLFASGLRNPSGLSIDLKGRLWAVVNERDGLGDDLPPDYATSVSRGAFYGWPYAYIGPHPDPQNGKEKPQLVKLTVVPDVLLEAHSAPLGIAFYGGAMFPADYRGDAFVAMHGSWNRSRFAGYKVVRLKMTNGRATGDYEDFMTGFVLGGNRVWGRPVSVAVALDGSLLVSDDGGDKIWRVSYGGK